MDEFQEMKSFQRKDLLKNLFYALIVLSVLLFFFWLICYQLNRFSNSNLLLNEQFDNIPSNSPTKLEKDILAASFIVYGYSTESSQKNTRCSATAFEKQGKIYRLLTAAHCVAKDNLKTGDVEALPLNLFVSFSDKDIVIYNAHLVAAGFQRRGDDFAVLEVKINQKISVIPLAKNNPHRGEEILNVSFPMSLGKQMVGGRVAIEKLDLSNFRDKKVPCSSSAVIIKMISGLGSSGSALVSRENKSIVGVLVGGYHRSSEMNEIAIGLPVSKFRFFWETVKTGEYSWYQSLEVVNENQLVCSEFEF